MQKVIVIEPFTLNGKPYTASEKPQEVPEAEVARLLRKKWISIPEEDAQTTEPSPLQVEMVSLIAPHLKSGEPIVLGLQRLLDERATGLQDSQDLKGQLDSTKDTLKTTQAQLGQVRAESAELRTQTAELRALLAEASQGTTSGQEEQKPLSNEEQQQPGTGPSSTPEAPVENAPAKETPVDMEALGKATAAPVALALLNAGFDTMEKLRTASDADLLGVDSIGEAMLGKVRNFTKE